jgi:phospholipase/lecithinase/hemolysin
MILTGSRRLIAVVAICQALGWITPAHAGPYSAIYAFGDSLSDVGNVFLGTGGAEPAPPYFAGRFSNGPIWLDYLAAQLGTGPMIPSLQGGTDYAFGLATTGFAPTLSTPSLVPTFVQQVALFNTATGVAPPSALYAVWIGANDLLNVLQSGAAGAQALALMQGAAATEATEIAALIGAGARSFLVGLLPDVGKAPAVTVLGPAAAAAASALAAAYNTALEADLPGVIAAGATISYLDAFSLLDAAVTDPGAFDLSNVTDPCYVGPLTGGGTVCATPDQYLFWDGDHPTTADHAIIAAVAADVLVPEPGTLSLLAVGLVGLLVCRRAHLRCRPPAI